MSYDEYRDMPCFAHRDASGKCNHTNRNYKFVNNIKANQEAGYKATGDNGLMAKEKRIRIRSPRMAVIWMKTLHPNPPKRQRVGLARVTHSKTPIKREPSTCSLDPPQLRHSELLCAPSMPSCQKSADTSPTYP
jgi:hypothetical protein